MNRTDAHRTLFVAWAALVGLRFTGDALALKGWPCPGRYFRMSGVYLLLALFSEVRPELAAMLGVGFAIAFAAREAAVEVPHGRFFGIPIGGRR